MMDRACKTAWPKIAVEGKSWPVQRLGSRRADNQWSKKVARLRYGRLRRLSTHEYQVETDSGRFLAELVPNLILHIVSRPI